MSRRLARGLSTVSLLLAIATLVSACGLVGWPWDTPMTTVRPKSDFGRLTHDLFMLISWWTLGIFILVEAGLVYVCWRFRDRPGAPIPTQVHGHTALEIGWTVAFAVILLIIGIPTIRIIFKTQEAPAASVDPLRIDVAGRQWWWEFNYPALKISTANEVHVPAGRVVDFHLNAPDVIHSFWTPQLGGKRDVVPRRVNRLTMTPDTPGEYPGQCAEYCGESHANMRFRVVVHAQDDFDRWVAAQLAPPVEPEGELAQQGKSLFTQLPCVGCHAIRGLSGGAIGPDLTHFGSRRTLASAMLPNTAPNLERWLVNPELIKPGVLMPNLGLSHDQAKALTAYLLSLK
jgi:cytochrome c oxidase subunit 2